MKRLKKADPLKLDEIYNKIYGMANVIYIESIMLSNEGFIEIAEDIRYQMSDFFFKLEKTSTAKRVFMGLENLKIILDSLYRSLIEKKIRNRDYIRIKKHLMVLVNQIRVLREYHLTNKNTTIKFYNPI